MPLCAWPLEGANKQKTRPWHTGAGRVPRHLSGKFLVLAFRDSEVPMSAINIASNGNT